MSIRPVDYQILMPKVNEMAKIQSSEVQKQIDQFAAAKNSVQQAERETKRTFQK